MVSVRRLTFTPLKQIPLQSRRQWKYLYPGVRPHSSSALFWDIPFWTVVHRCLVLPANPYPRLTERSGVFASFDIGETTRIDKLQGGVHGVNFGFGSSNDAELNVSDSHFYWTAFVVHHGIQMMYYRNTTRVWRLIGSTGLKCWTTLCILQFLIDWLIEWNKF